MQELLYILVSVIRITLGLLKWLMLARLLLSFFPLDDENAILRFVYAVTEPLIFPVRNILERFDFFANSPIDFSAILSYYILVIVGAFF